MRQIQHSQLACSGPTSVVVVVVVVVVVHLGATFASLVRVRVCEHLLLWLSWAWLYICRLCS
ncbi:MAG: hypothetical protein N6V41_01725, partial [Candidatus Portiera aleyrodidarum]|nr:hypothetical protein [Candidatus Portiera aleyrodidarum]